MNDSSMPSSDLVQLTYRLLNLDTYYDKMDLFLHANGSRRGRSATAHHHRRGAQDSGQDSPGRPKAPHVV